MVRGKKLARTPASGRYKLQSCPRGTPFFIARRSPTRSDLADCASYISRNNHRLFVKFQNAFIKSKQKNRMCSAKCGRSCRALANAEHGRADSDASVLASEGVGIRTPPRGSVLGAPSSALVSMFTLIGYER